MAGRKVRRPRTKVVWSTQAVDELREVVEYIRQDRPRAARKVAQQIKEATRRLELFPLSGRIVPEFPMSNYREIIVGNYRIVYEPVESEAQILTVVHGMRDLPSQPLFKKQKKWPPHQNVWVNLGTGKSPRA